MDDFELELLLLEFEAEGAEPSEENADEEFSMDDDVVETPDTDSQDAGDQPAEEETSDEEYTMDDEDESEQSDDQQQDEETTEEPEEDQEDEEYEIPDDEEENPDEPGQGDTGDDEFSMDDDGGDSGEEGDTSDNDADTTDSGSEPVDPDSKIRELETVVFDNLTDNEKNLKIKELKNLFIEIHKRCETIADKTSDLKTDEETIQISEYISSVLHDLRLYIRDYLSNVFDSKTYIENLAHLQKYITIFNAINKVFIDINQENDK